VPPHLAWSRRGLSRSLVGGVWLMWVLGYNLSVAVAVGFIALAGVAAETGVVMLIYLDQAWAEARRRCHAVQRKPSSADLYAAVMEGAVERVRPKMMTVVAIMAGLLPIMWGTGTGSEVMSRIAAPMVGGMISSTVLTLAVIPALCALVKGWEPRRDMGTIAALVQAPEGGSDGTSFAAVGQDRARVAAWRKDPHEHTHVFRALRCRPDLSWCRPGPGPGVQAGYRHRARFNASRTRLASHAQIDDERHGQHGADEDVG
jgi:hypothetical protein